MGQAVAKKLVYTAVSQGYIKKEQLDEYLYGLNMLIDILINDITMLLIGVIMHMLWECIVFWLAYKILRKYCGGFHFSSSLKCYFSSCFMCPIALLSIQFIPYNMLLWIITTFICVIILFLLSPVAAANKPLDEKEFTVFRKIARIIILCLSTAYIITTITGAVILTKILALSILCVTLFVVFGKIELLKQRKTN